MYEVSIEDIILKYHKSSNQPTYYKTSTLTKWKGIENHFESETGIYLLW